MGLVCMGIPQEMALFLKEIFKSDLFIETGTYHGGTTEWASEHFKKVHTIELSEPLYNITSKRLAHIDNIHFHFGDTRQLLNKILLEEDASENAMIWLDAHWSSDITYGENDQCPLLSELDILLHSKQEMCIFIDDARLFTAPPPKPNDYRQYPDIQQIFEVFKNNRFIAIYNDVIIIVPLSLKESLQEYLHIQTTIDWNNYAKQISNSGRSSLKGILISIINRLFK